jgi:macrodomain Ter protein organizer (MatP/YcbG family)
MGGDLKPHSSKHKQSHEKDPDRKSKKRHKHGDNEGSRHRKRKRKDSECDKLHIMDDDPDDEDMWVEKNMDGELVRTL